ncbi:MAG: DEAD/DEAH box helicase, partial [Deltaproteobacteria bacterium]|nr:DEAD/DEAH box helicase [Deltaproteobacteria bacterium]
MLPSVLATQLRQMLSDYITTNFPMSNSFFKDTLPSLLSPDSVSPIFHDPYISVRLPFRISEEEENLFSAFLLNFKPYVHQRQAFLRLNGDGAKSTLIATGTGSGKTECFLYPILEYSCNNHSEGIKALLIYPMNALANDQAKRIAKLIHENPNLKNNVTAGLYTGQKDNIHNSMGEDHIISDRAVLRNRPPDILLTNYKMLDYLLLRPVDSSLWEKNDAETLKYIVVDELHTFDGAKGTDLACLIRRLKSRLATPKNYLCCVGTSATMGAKETSASILNFAEKIFGESFPEDSLITEDRLTASQFVSGWDILRSNVPSRAQMDNLKIFSQKDDPDSYLTLAAQSWLGANIPKTRISDPDICLSLSDKLRHHSFFHHLLRFAEDRPFQAKEALKELQNYFPDLGNDGQSQAALYAFLDLISHARIGTIDSPRPFLTVNVQLWLRELHRLVAKVGHKNEIVYSLAHDLNETQGPTFLPVINCRDCGETGWVSSINSKRCVSISDYSNFYKKFFSLDSEIKMLFPYEGVSSEIDDNETGDNNNDDLDGTKKKDHKLSGKASLGHSTPHLGQASKFSYGLLCPHCMTLKAPLAQISAEEAQNPCSECGTKGLIPVRIPDLSPAKKKSFHRIQYVCPFCGSTTGVTLMGWRSTTAISTCLSQIFASKFNNDKKTLAFSDNVQDAAYLAGFFNNRAWRFGIRSAIQQYARAVGTKNFQTFSEEFTEHWKNKWSMEQLVSLFTPPNLSYRREYEEMKENRSFPDTEQNQSFLALLSKRLKYEIMLEYGLYSRRGGRSLVGTGCSLLAYPPHLIQKTADIAFEKALNELGISKNDNAGLTFQRMTLGILDIMRANGAFYDRTFEKFAYKGGNTYFLTKKFFHWIPGVQPGRNTPRFPYIPSSSFNTTNAFDLFRSTKYTTWIRACSNQLLLNSDILGEIVKRILKELEQSGLIATLLERNNVWGLNKENLTLTTEVVTLECDSCGTHLNAAKINSELWDGAPCLRNNCRGHYKLMKNPNISYYARLYSEGDIVRLNAHEHTGILSQVQRDTLEKSFKVPSDEQQPWDTNILTCTPTMEMGIDIGDLSTVILCNVPPAESQFLQRSGRAGRKDGNSLVVTVANAKPHDLYFFEQPEDMIKGTIKVPTVFIQAPAVLERQFFAFIMDNWVRKGDNGRPIQHRAIPENINKCLNNLEKKDTNIYPFNFLNYTDKNLSNLIDNFLEMFAGELEEESINALEIYAKGDGKNEKPVFIKLLNAFRMQKKEIESLNQNIRNI